MQKLLSPSLNVPEEGCAFGAFRLESDGTLLHGEEVIHLPPKELAALRLLVANAGQIVPPLQLKQALWGETHVSADILPKCLTSLQARLEPEVSIQSIYKRGYRFSAEVRRPGCRTAAPLLRLAVLPFITGFTVPEHLGFAIAEDTIIRLSNVRRPPLSILARDSVFSLAERGWTSVEVGKALQADLVLAGTLSALAGQFRLRAEMISVPNGAQIWVEDFLVSQDRITHLEAELAERLDFRLNQGELAISAVAQEPQRESKPLEREAYESYLRGHHEWQSLQRHQMQDGLQHLLRATDLDPSLIPAKVDLAHLCVTQAFYGFMSPAVSADYVRRTAQSIPDLALHAAAILPALGWVEFHVDHNLPAALNAFSQSAHLPHDPWITRVRSMFALSRHRFDEAIEMLRAAIRIDPYSMWLHARLAWALHLSGEAAASVDCIRKALAVFPGHAGGALYGAAILGFNGEAAEAITLAEGLVRQTPYFDLATGVHAYALACDGRKEEARFLVERLQWLSRERFVLGAFTPAVYVALGDLDGALAELRTEADVRCPWFLQMLADPRLEPLHGRPEFEQLRSLLTGMEEGAAQALQLQA
jgi:DNA-binding winged helix-turn-helix (wHTH) protein/tetratricopeptide (TPR) repeat protein